MRAVLYRASAGSLARVSMVFTSGSTSLDTEAGCRVGKEVTMSEGPADSPSQEIQEKRAVHASVPRRRSRTPTYAILLFILIGLYFAISFSDLPRTQKMADHAVYSISMDARTPQNIQIIDGPRLDLDNLGNKTIEGSLRVTLAGSKEHTRGHLAFGFTDGDLMAVRSGKNGRNYIDLAPRPNEYRRLFTRSGIRGISGTGSYIVVVPFTLIESNQDIIVYFRDTISSDIPSPYFQRRRWGESNFTVELRDDPLIPTETFKASSVKPDVFKTLNSHAPIPLQQTIHLSTRSPRALTGTAPAPRVQSGSELEWTRLQEEADSTNSVSFLVSGSITNDQIRFWVDRTDNIVALILGGIVGVLLEQLHQAKLGT